MNAPLGLLQWTEGTRGPQVVENVQRAEALDYQALWLPKVAACEPFATSRYLLVEW